jgi:hypothetical protein
MSRKDYVAIAEILKRHHDVEEMDKETLISVAKNLAHVFKANNQRFDTERFLNACGIK